MATSHALLILASLFFLPVLLGDYVNFEYCNKNGYDYAEVNSVKVNLAFEHDLRFDIFVDVYAEKNIPGSNTFVYVSVKFGGDDPDFRAMTYSLCDVTSCNTNGETEAAEFLLKLLHVPVIGDKDHNYTYSISVRTNKGQEPSTIFTCVDFKLYRDALAHTLASA